MPDLKKQFLLKMMPELEETINKAFSEYLKLTGDAITKAEYIRRCLELSCFLELAEANMRKQKENLIIKYPKLFAERIGKNLFYQIMAGLSACNKLQTNHDLYVMNDKYNKDIIASKRNRLYLFFRIVSDIYEFENSLNEILQLLHKNEKYSKTIKSNYYLNLLKFRKEINRNSKYSKIRNQIGSHDGDIKYFDAGLDIIDNDGYFKLAECLSDPITNAVSSNSVFYNSTDLILKTFKISEIEWRDLMKHTLKVSIDGIDDFQLLFHAIYTEALADGQIYRENI